MPLRRTATCGIALLLLAGCAGPEERARNDGAREIRDQLERVESDLATSLHGFDPRKDRTLFARDVTGLASQVGSERITYDFGMTATGSVTSGFSNVAASVGACFRVVGDRRGGTIEQIGCPRSFREQPGAPVEAEVEVIDSRRSLPDPPKAPYGGCNPGGESYACPGG